MCELSANMPIDFKLKTSTGTSEIPQIKGGYLATQSKGVCNCSWKLTKKQPKVLCYSTSQGKQVLLFLQRNLA